MAIFSPRFHHKNISAVLTGLLFFTTTTSSVADENCAPDLIAKQQSIPPNLKSDRKKHVQANSLSQPGPGEYLLEGNVNFSQAGLVIIGNRAQFDQQTNQASFSGGVEFHQEQFTLTTEEATIDNSQQRAELKQARYQLQPSRTHGKAEQIAIEQQQQKAKLKNANLSSCRLNIDGSLDWELKFKDLEVNNQNRKVIGKDTWFYFKGMPLLYTPYFEYPLDDRATGLLFPEFGSYKSISQDRRLNYYKQPYYFNIAANIDDTLSLIPIERRGLAIENEFRYLAKSKNVSHGAELTLSAIDDQLVADKGLAILENGQIGYKDADSQRWRIKLKAHQNWGGGITSFIDWQATSDEMFYQDIPVDRQLKNSNALARNAGIDYQAGNLHAYARIQSHLQLLNQDDSYETKPEIGLRYSQTVFGLENLNFDLFANWSDFSVSSANHNLAEGSRLHLQPQLSHSLRNSYAFLDTTLRANFTQYQMDDNGFNPSTETTINRSVHQFAVRSGLIFERGIEIGNASLTQTLEPELQYLYTPYVDQADINLFDSDYLSPNFDNLFAMNRFTGLDRIADSNQLSMALKTRLLNNQAKQLASAALGQIVYFDDRQVQLNGSQIDSNNYSDWFTQIQLDLDNWQLLSTTQLDRDNFSLVQASNRIKWQNNNTTVMLSHILYDDELIEDNDLLTFGAYSQLTDKWQIGILNNYDLVRDDYSEIELGLRYQSCCWATEIVAERTQLENGLYNDGIQIQFELKGLSTANSGFKQKLINKLDF